MRKVSLFRVMQGAGKRGAAAACLLGLLTSGLALPAQAQTAAPATPPTTATPTTTPPASPPELTPPAASAPAATAPRGHVVIDVRDTKPPEEADVALKDGALELSLDDALSIALRHNLGLLVQRYVRVQSRLQILQNLGIYDVQLGGVLSYQDQKNSTATSRLQAAETKNYLADLNATQLFPLGSTLTVDLPNGRTDQTVNSIQQNLPTTYSVIPKVTFTQPLLTGFGETVTDQGLIIARNNSESSRAELVRQVTLTMQQVIDGYWNLVNAKAQLVVAQESLGLAKELHERNRIQVQVGTAAPLDLVNSEAAIATREEEIITAQSAVGDTEDALRQLLNLPPGALWNAEIKPTTPAETDRLSVNLEEAVRTGLAARPEVRENQLAVDNAKVQQAVAKNALLPTLDLQATYGFGGPGITYSDAWKTVTNIDFPGWSAQLTFGYPLQNRRARAQHLVSQLNTEAAKTNLTAAERQVLTEVRTAARGVDTAAKSIDAAHASRNFEEKNLDAERKRYENGMSTTYQITLIQNDLTGAKSREVTAVINYRKALAEYYRAIGKLLEQHSVEIADPPDRGHRFSFSGKP
ncbi:MAG TPA: TolC family protein [Thermoanaerobaculia bacterium]